MMWQLMLRSSLQRWLAAYVACLVLAWVGENWRSLLADPSPGPISIAHPLIHGTFWFAFQVGIAWWTDRVGTEREAAPRFEATRARSGEILPPTPFRPAD